MPKSTVCLVRCAAVLAKSFAFKNAATMHSSGVRSQCRSRIYTDAWWSQWVQRPWRCARLGHSGSRDRRPLQITTPLEETRLVGLRASASAMTLGEAIVLLRGCS